MVEKTRGRILREEQRLHREELKLARLKAKTNKARQADTRLKLLLGNLFYVVGWDWLSVSEIEECLPQVNTLISDKTKRDYLEALGQKALSELAKKKTNRGRGDMLSDELRELNHRKITAGGLLVKHGLQKYSRSIIIGAIIESGGDGQLRV